MLIAKYPSAAEPVKAKGLMENMLGIINDGTPMA